VTLLTLALGSSLVKTDYEAERLAQPKRPTLKLAFRLCLGPYRHLAQFVFYPNCKHAHVWIYRTCRCSPMFCSKKTTRYPRI